MPLSRNHLRSSRTASPSLRRRHIRDAPLAREGRLLQPADALSSTQNNAQPETPPPAPPPTPDPPAKIPDLSHLRFPSFPPSERTSLPRQAQDIPACTADFVAARSRIDHTRHDSRVPISCQLIHRGLHISFAPPTCFCVWPAAAQTLFMVGAALLRRNVKNRRPTERFPWKRIA